MEGHESHRHTWQLGTAKVPLGRGLLMGTSPLLADRCACPKAYAEPAVYAVRAAPAAQLAEEKLVQMGPMSRDEKIMLCTMGGAVLLWVGVCVGQKPPCFPGILGMSSALGMLLQCVGAGQQFGDFRSGHALKACRHGAPSFFSSSPVSCRCWATAWASQLWSPPCWGSACCC